MADRDPAYLATLGYGYARAGRTSEARGVLKGLEALAGGGNVAMMLAKVHTGLGQLDEAFSWLDQAFTNRDGWLVGLSVEPGFDPLRNDPRYQQLLRRMGLAGQ